MDIETLDRSLDKARKGGVLTVDLMLEARARGFQAELLEGNRTVIADSIAQRVPLILLVRVMNAPGGRADLFHYLVVDGWDGELDLVRVHFGDGTRRWAELARLDRSWARAGHTTLRIRPDHGEGTPPL